MIYVRALRGSLRRGAAITAALALTAGSLSAAATPSLAAAGSQSAGSQTAGSQTAGSQTAGSQTAGSQTAGSQSAGGTPSLAGPSGPVIDQNFADPDVMKVGHTYYTYATNTDGRHIRWATSTDLTHWTVQPGDALPTLGAWADPTWTFPPGGSGDHGVWAPEVFATGPHRYVMWYVAHDRASGKQCIGAATATGPGGPFTPRATAFICTPDLGGVIDPTSYREGAHRYVVWKNDGNCCALDTWLRLQEVTADGLRRVGPETKLVKQNKPYEGDLVEAPTLIRHGHTYVLFYSANFFGNGSYMTGYATATRLRGPYIKAPAPLMTTDAFDGAVRGPGGQDIVAGPDGRDRIVFHGWNAAYTYRAMYVQPLYWHGDRPIVQGAKIHYEAEDADLSRVRVHYAAGGASGGVVVGGIDYPDSRVTFSVYAPRAGTYRLFTRYANGSDGGAASHTLSVNGVVAGTVDYPVTGWDHWQVSQRTVTLRQGANTLTYAKGGNFAEVDAIDVA